MDELSFDKNIGSDITQQKLSKKGITVPSIELNDFFEFLDPKVVEKIKQTPKNELNRITNDVNQYEYDFNGAKNILNYLK